MLLALGQLLGSEVCSLLVCDSQPLESVQLVEFTVMIGLSAGLTPQLERSMSDCPTAMLDYSKGAVIAVVFKPVVLIPMAGCLLGADRACLNIRVQT